MISNLLMQFLVKTKKIREPKGLPRYGGKQYLYSVDDVSRKNVNTNELGKYITYMTNEEILEFIEFFNNEYKPE